MARATARAAQPLNVVDSSAWLEYLTGGPQAARFADAIEDSKRLVVPAIVLYEGFKKVLRERGEHQALRVAGKPLEKSTEVAARRMNEFRSGFMHCKTTHHHLRDEARSDAERGHAARQRLNQFIRDT